MSCWGLSRRCALPGRQAWHPASMHTACTAAHAGALPCATLWSLNPKLAPAAGNTLGLLGVSTGLAATLGAVSQVNSDPAVLAQVSCPCCLPACCLAGLGGWVARLTGHQPAPHLPDPAPHRRLHSRPPALADPPTHPPTHPPTLPAYPGLPGHWWRRGCHHRQEDGHHRPAPDGG